MEHHYSHVLPVGVSPDVVFQCGSLVESSRVAVGVAFTVAVLCCVAMLGGVLHVAVGVVLEVAVSPESSRVP